MATITLYALLYSLSGAVALFSQQELPRCTAQVDSLTTLERQVIAEINLARSRPQVYAAILTEIKADYKGNIYYRPGAAAGVETREGVAAVDEAIRYLLTVAPCDTLKHAACLSLAARDHVEDSGVRGLLGHKGSDGSEVFERVQRYVKPQVSAGECISYGPYTARGIVAGLLIDDGVASRIHRVLLFKTSLQSVGVAFGPHQRFRHMCVINFSSEIIQAMQ